MIDQINYAIKNLVNRRTRSWLTVLSILIGITSIFALLSFGYGIGAYMDEIAEEAGADKLFLQARGSGAPGLDDNFYISKDEFEFVKKLKGINEAAPLYMKVAQASFKDEIKYNFIMGYDPKDYEFVFESFTADMFKGRPLKSGETNKILIGYNYQFEDKIFKKPISLGDTLEINGVAFDVIGFVDEIGNPSDDANLYVTLEAMELLYTSLKNKYAMVMMSAEKGEDPDEIAERVEEKLRKYKGLDEGKEDFYVQSFADIIATFGAIIDILNGVLLLIALISIVVAGVNIMNTMYTSVLERTREIGIMKSIGARNGDIMFIFVFESGLLGFMGGVLGIVLGYLVAKMGGAIATASGYSALQPVFTLGLVIGCAVFAFGIGAIAGFLPARQASRLKPTDALRYE